MKYLFDLDFFGEEPDLYYKRKSQKNATIGLVFTIIHLLLVLFFFIFKLIRMINLKISNFMIHMHMIKRFLQ